MNAHSAQFLLMIDIPSKVVVGPLEVVVLEVCVIVVEAVLETVVVVAGK